MDKLWAPWRIKYIKSKKNKKCIFCEATKSNNKNYVILKTKYSLSMLNIFPYNNGHVMISPLRHIQKISQLKETEIIDLFKTVDKTIWLLDKILKPHGYNIGINLSEAAGAGIPTHLHLHIVPRWRGDTNFMPIVSNTKVISQSLSELYKQLKNVRSERD
jgi:ATP adenylyltransferase